MERLLGKCVGLISKEPWLRVCAVFEPYFTHTSMHELHDVVINETVKYVRSFEAIAEASGRIDPIADLKMLPFAVMARIIYGELPQGLRDDLYQIASPRECIFSNVIRGGITRLQWASYLPIPKVRAAFRELKEFEISWRAFNEGAYGHALNAKNKGSLGAPIIAIYGAFEEGLISTDELLQTVIEILFANLDVTMGAVSWAIVYQASNQEVQANLLQEINSRATRKRTPSATWQNDAAPASITRQLESSYLSETSTYLYACLLESARLKPLAAFSVPQAAPTDRILDGYRIPAGTNFIVDSHAINIRNGLWGPDATNFRPERFLDGGSSSASTVIGRRYRYWRFGFGPRQCLGRHLADLILRVLLIELIGHFEISIPKEGQDWQREAQMWITHPVIQLKISTRSLGSL